MIVTPRFDLDLWGHKGVGALKGHSAAMCREGRLPPSPPPPLGYGAPPTPPRNGGEIGAEDGVAVRGREVMWEIRGGVERAAGTRPRSGTHVPASRVTGQGVLLVI